jgi:hypothetical protein
MIPLERKCLGNQAGKNLRAGRGPGDRPGWGSRGIHRLENNHGVALLAFTILTSFLSVAHAEGAGKISELFLKGELMWIP